MFYRSFCLGLSVEFKVQNDFIMSAGLRLLPLVQILEEMASLLHHDLNEGGILISLVEITHNDGVLSAGEVEKLSTCVKALRRREKC